MLLTIAIPVYNGEKNIRRTIESVMPLRRFGDCEVLIIDNASEDNTEKIARECVDDGDGFIRYERNDYNLGYDQNVDKLVERAYGEYVWFMGCGDYLLEGGGEYVRNVLISDHYGVVTVAFDTFNELSGVYERVSRQSRDMTSLDKNDFSFPRYNPLVSANIVNAKLWLECRKPLLVDGFVHIEQMLNMMASGRCLSFYVATPVFVLFRDAEGWYTMPDSYRMFLRHIVLVDNLINLGFDPVVVGGLHRRLSRFPLVAAIVQSRRSGLKIDKAVFLEFYWALKSDYWYWLFVVPALFFPLFFLRYAGVMYRCLKKMVGRVGK